MLIRTGMAYDVRTSRCQGRSDPCTPSGFEAYRQPHGSPCCASPRCAEPQRNATPLGRPRRHPSPLTTTTRQAFHSQSLGRAVGYDDLLSLELPALLDLCQEVGAELTAMKAQLETTSRSERHQLQQLHARRAFLAPFHQAVSRRRSELKPRHNRHQPALRPIDAVPPVEAFFLPVARQALEPGEFQRLLLIAEQRRAAEMARATGMCMDVERPGHD